MPGRIRLLACLTAASLMLSGCAAAALTTAAAGGTLWAAFSQEDETVAAAPAPEASAGTGEAFVVEPRAPVEPVQRQAIQ